MLRNRIVIPAALGLLLACAALPATAQSTEPLTGSTSDKGKGVPNGSSDSDEPFAPLQGISPDMGYGRSVANPIRVGGTGLRQGPMREKLFLNALRGPSGESISYEREGSCCAFKTPNGIMGSGLLDVFRITMAGREPITLYLNFYDAGEELAPAGFTIRTKK
jgi:hypothetical protein